MPRARLQPKPAAPPVQPQALTIIQFCEAFGISEAFYYKLKRQGIGPKEMKLGTRILISMEAAAQWRTERENAAEQG
jgi:predicted DNA-binding transcriptional regulator AlpA